MQRRLGAAPNGCDEVMLWEETVCPEGVLNKVCFKSLFLYAGGSTQTGSCEAQSYKSIRFTHGRPKLHRFGCFEALMEVRRSLEGAWATDAAQGTRVCQ